MRKKKKVKPADIFLPFVFYWEQFYYFSHSYGLVIINEVSSK